MKVLVVAILIAVFLQQGKVEGGDLYTGHQLWRITPMSEQTLRALRDLGEAYRLDFWKDPAALGRPVDMRVAPEQASKLRGELASRGIYDIEISINDIQELINNQKVEREQTMKNSASGRAVKSIVDFDYTVYHDADEVYAWMDMVTDEFNFITKKQVAMTYQGRPMYVLEVKKPSIDGFVKPVIYVDSLIHCREWISTASLLFIFKEMLTNPDFGHMVDNVDWYFVPMINIDGYVETWTGDRLWRKTMSTGASTLCSGVDANRNWATSQWSWDGASPHPCSFAYHGPTPASECEVRHLQNYIIEHKDEISAVITVHSYSQLILYPFGYTEELPPENEILNATAKAMSDAVFSKHGKRYVYGPSSTTIYVTSGDTTDWTYEVAGIVQSHTYELRDEGRYGFLLPADQIVPNGEEFLLGLEVMANYVDGVAPTKTIPKTTTHDGSGAGA